ncbi:MAG TPA: Nif3-like dinuclear metal center hexameric protein [Desulfomonilia bacterium]|nr:Nif3-like dinuclear metal center hexameric protein [Desulfomonilia bacterium]
MKLKDVMKVLDAMAPFDGAEEWDNVGIMVGDPASEVRSVLVALDPTIEVIRGAGRAGTDLILTHHPLMIQPLTRLDLSQGVARKISLLIQGHMSLVSMHTNLDKAAGGVADELAAALGLLEVRRCGAMRTGTIRKASPLAGWVRGLPFPHPRICDAGRPVHRVAACPGSGMDYWLQARENGCDTFVTGDVRYHAAMEAVEAGMNVIDVGHFGSEGIIVKPLAARLKKELKGVAVRAHRGKDVFSYL